MVKVEINDNLYEIFPGQANVKINGESKIISLEHIDKNRYHIILNNRSVNAKVISLDVEESQLILAINDREYKCRIRDKRSEILTTIAINTQKSIKSTFLKSPMPGLIEKILVSEGDEVKENDPLIILNAMKMENTLKATKEGKVEKIFIQEGQQVEKGKELLQF